jgi:hypothetical protein
MESQQMMKILLAMQEDSKAWQEDMKTMQERAEAERKSDREEMKQEIRAAQKKIQENLKRTMEEMMNMNQAKTDGKLKELTETIEKTQTEPSPEMMQPVGEHQEVPREEAAVIPVSGWKRRHRGRKQAAGRCGEPKELTRGEGGSRKKLAAACRKASRHATVAYRKRNVFRISWTHENCGPRKEVTTAGKKVTRCAGHRCKRNIPLYTWRSPKGGTFENRCRKGPQCNTGIKDPTTNGIEGWSPGE